MILDSIENIGRYKDVEGLREAVEYLQQHSCSGLKPGHYDIDGDRLFMNVAEFTGKNPDEARYEVHGNYIDLQYVLEGSEKMGYLPDPDGKAIESADYDHDIWFYPYDEKETNLTVRAGMFAVFFPGELHAPGMSFEGNGRIRKAVLKIHK